MSAGPAVYSTANSPRIDDEAPFVVNLPVDAIHVADEEARP